ncbi:hypothetical protein A9Q84_10495 [Halobacteriovorax marinus]|uniref:Thioredoxin reductase n=1 Tax=Halobacteriovorax marinus TaxID=97084 RepID=A0A1Y5FBC6_9BACT|nr:hypothetical protein A9Q84_10495 [Halobacteriovorax marinus]
MKQFELIIMGAGPAGISLAAEAVQSGVSPEKIIILEKSQEHSFSIRRFYPEQKLVTANYKGKEALCNGVMCISDTSKSATLSYLDKCIEDFKINVHYSETVWKIEKQVDESFIVATDKGDYQGKICAIAMGMMGKPNKPSYPIPSDIKAQVTFEITSKKIENCEVMVVGGGDSASEYAQYLLQEGNKVTFCYRKKDFSRMNQINRDSLLALGQQGRVDIQLETDVLSLSKRGDRVVAELTGKTSEREFDHVVLALGGTTPKNFLSLLGIEFNGNEPVIKEGFETSIAGLFLIGDLGAGRRGGSIISAFNSSREAMQKICTDYLTCNV